MYLYTLRNLLSAFVALSLFLVPVYAYSASALWIAESKGVIKVATSDGAILFEIPDAKGVEGVAVDNANGQVWTYGDERLKAYSANGVIEINERHASLPNKDKPVDMLADSEGVWLAIDKELFRFDTQGKLQKSIRFKHKISTLTLDTMRNRLWLAVPGTVFILDSQGRDLKRFRTHFVAIEQLEYDASLDQAWVVVDPFVLRLDAKTLAIKYISDFGVGFRLRDQASADGQGGLWGAEDKIVSHLNAQGDLDVRFKPFPGNSHAANLQDLAADSDDGSVWVANRTTLKHYNLTGAQQKEFVPDLGDGIIRSINRMALAEPGSEAPVISITAPANGAFVNSNKPMFELEYATEGTIDTDSIEIKRNETLLDTNCTADQTTAQCSINTALDEGEITLSATIANDDGKRSEPATVTFTVDTLAPVIFISVPQDGLITNNPSLTIEGNVDEPLDSLTLNHNGSISTLTLNNNTFSRGLTLSEGANTLTVSATDLAGNPDSLTVTVSLDTGVPVIPDIQQITISNPANGIVTITGGNNSVEPNSRATITNARTGERITVTADANGAFTATVAAADGDTLSIQVTDAANNQSGSVETQVADLPPDPGTVAPQLNPTQITPLLDAVSFLFAGSDPIQTGVMPGTIEAKRVAIIRGKVLDRQNKPLPGVTIRVKDHPEFGETLSRADGMFDLAVNGGGVLTLNYIKEDYLPVQRQVNAPWRDYIFADDIVMIQLDPQVTVIDLTSTQAIQVAQGTPQTDADGTRQATILFPAGTTATMTLPDGTVQQLTTLSVRATEYTVGENGPEAMPAPLPPTSGYTYAVELSVDEAIAAGVKRNGVDVRFNQPVPFYVDNFPDFPAGESVPVGYYDGDKAAWIPYENGRIVKILSIENEMAMLDVTGAGNPATPEELATLGITDAERTSLAELYEPGKSLWRVALEHFSTWDCNWPYGPPQDAESPPSEPPQVADKEKPDEECTATGCTISTQTQSLGEEIPITGTPYSLHYRSDRMPGRASKNSVSLTLSGASVPESLRSIRVSIYIAGQSVSLSFPDAPGQEFTYEWDGRDGFGREVYGSATADIYVRYVYPCIYYDGDNGFGSFLSSANAIGTRRNCQAFVFPRHWQVRLESPLQPPVNTIGNWSLNVHHAWESSGSRLFLGDGSERTLQRMITIKTVAGNGGRFSTEAPNAQATAVGISNPEGVAVDAAGNFYVTDLLHRVRRVSPDGIITTIAGTVTQPGFSGDGGPAAQALLSGPTDVALDGEGNLYIADSGNRRIRKIDRNGIITTVAGNGVSGFAGDGGPATAASLSSDLGIALDTAGNLYIADAQNNRIRRVSPDGIITTIAGSGPTGSGSGTGFSGDGGLATQARLRRPADIAIDQAGNLYIADSGNQRVRRVSPEGIITTVAGAGFQGVAGDGGPATEARLISPHGLVLDAAGNLYIADHLDHRVRRVSPDGTIITVAGGSSGIGGFSGDNAPGTGAQLASPAGLDLDAEGNLYIADSGNNRVRKMSRLGLQAGERVASEDGIRQFVFDTGGRHLQTLNTVTGKTEYTFGRDSQGRLIRIIDIDGDVTTIERNSNGDATAIISPDGQRTGLTVDAKGHLRNVTNPASERYTMDYTDGGLLTAFHDRRNHLNSFDYDSLGRLIQDTDAGGGGWTASNWAEVIAAP